MANVFLTVVAGPGGFNKLLVLKTVRDDVVRDIEGGTEMFLAEARLTARLVHPNIVATYEIAQYEGRYCIAMEYLEGQSYRAVCGRGRPNQLSLEDELRVLAEAARGLHYAHELENYDGTPLGVVHRDVSPQNIFITYDGLVKLIDFGIAKTAESERATEVGVVKGKLDYMAPEQLSGGAIDRRADVFALGAMLWEAVTGARFAGGPTVLDVVKAENRLAGSEPRVRELQSQVPEPLAQIVDRSIALDVAARFESAAAFADALDDYLASSTHQPSAKSLSATVMPLFQVERQRLRKAVEEQILLSETCPFVGISREDSLTTAPSSLWAVGAAAETGVEPTERIPRAVRARLEPAAGTGTEHPAAKPRMARSASKLTTIVIAAGAALVGGTVGSLTRGQADSSVRPHNPATPDGVIQLSVTVSPAAAHVALDGTPLELPFSGEFRQTTAMHQLSVTADACRPPEQRSKLAGDPATHEQQLAPPRRARSQAQRGKPAAPVEVSPARGALAPTIAAQVRPLDTTDPYAEK